MKTCVKSLFVIWMAVVLVACTNITGTADIWETAVYTADTAFGSGSKTVTVTVEAEEKSVDFTLHTDQENLADALLEHQLVSGEQGAYGLYIKTVNGMLADYDIDQTYWSLYCNDTVLQTGAEGVALHDGDCFRILYVR